MSKKQLLPKDLAARAEKVDPAKVEAEVLRIVSAKPPARGPLTGWDPILQAGLMGLQSDPFQQAQSRMQNMQARAQQLEQLYMAEQPRLQQQGVLGSFGSILGLR